MPSAAVGDLLAAYNALRAFSWQLRLSPFSFPDFAAAMAATQVRKGLGVVVGAALGGQLLTLGGWWEWNGGRRYSCNGATAGSKQ